MPSVQVHGLRHYGACVQLRPRLPASHVVSPHMSLPGLVVVRRMCHFSRKPIPDAHPLDGIPLYVRAHNSMTNIQAMPAIFMARTPTGNVIHYQVTCHITVNIRFQTNTIDTKALPDISPRSHMSHVNDLQP